MLLVIPVLSFIGDGGSEKINGAWVLREGDITHTLVIIDGYHSLSSFNIPAKRFIQTQGGPVRVDGDMLIFDMEYDTADSSNVGSTHACSFQLKGDKLGTYLNGKDEAWTRTDNGSGALAGNWRITGRMQNGQLVQMRPGARKTIKLLSGKRFQWAAINTETGQFFGTGGGTYTFENGKYTEHIEFFSRDSSRVGMSLSFDGKVDGRNWHHSGKSSKGDPIDEVWSR